MAVNVPSGSTAKLSYGPGIVYLGVEGTTPTVDVGYVKGTATVSIARENLKVEQGSPKTLVTQYVIRENVGIKFTGIEWNLNNFKYALGAGTTGASGANQTFEFGGSTSKASYAVRYLHIAADGSTIDIQLFKTQGAGTLDLNMPDEDLHEFNYEFQCLEGTSDFANAALTSGKKLFKIVRTAV